MNYYLVLAADGSTKLGKIFMESVKWNILLKYWYFYHKGIIFLYLQVKLIIQYCFQIHYFTKNKLKHTINVMPANYCIDESASTCIFFRCKSNYQSQLMYDVLIAFQKQRNKTSSFKGDNVQRTNFSKWRVLYHSLVINERRKMLHQNWKQSLTNLKSIAISWRRQY